MMKAKMMKSGGMAKKKGYAAGGMMDEGKMMGKMGRGMAKADMQKRAEMKKGGIAEAIKKHEKSSPVHKAGLKAGGMAKMKSGGKAKMAYGGMAKKMKSGGAC